jgi:cysteine desulfuration protein SufE
MFDEIRQTFSSFKTAEERYNFLMDLGKKLPFYSDTLKTPDRLVPGCQSQLWLSTTFANGKLSFNAHSDALISKGLAALLIWAYNGCSPEELLRNPPQFLQELGIFASLSPSRSNGLAQVYVRMQKEAIQYLNY